MLDAFRMKGAHIAYVKDLHHRPIYAYRIARERELMDCRALRICHIPVFGTIVACFVITKTGAFNFARVPHHRCGARQSGLDGFRSRMPCILDH